MKKIYSCLICLVGFALTSQAQASDPTHVWDFDEPVVNNKVEGWEVINYANPNTVDGILNLTTTNTGYPDLEYRVPEGVVLDPSVSKQIVIRVKNGTSSRRGRFYWVKAGVNYRFDFLLTIEDTEFQEYVIDLTHDSRWSGDIESIRFEIPMPVPAGSVGTIVSVDQIKLLEAPPTPQPMPPMIPAPFGVNLASAGFANSDYEYPQSGELDYFKSKDLNLLRVSFKWERLQPELNGPFAERDINELKNMVWAARTRGMWVILDMHNYGRRSVDGVTKVIGEPGLSIAHSADIWKRIAEEFKDFGNIYAYGLMNEPYGMTNHTPWVNIAQGMIDGIRTTDSHTAIMVGGESYSSAARWLSESDNLRNLVDPSDNLIFEAHVYFDDDASGSYNQSYDLENTTENTGIERLRPFVEWLNKYNLRGFVGEYGVPNTDPRWNVVLDKTLAYLQENNINGTYWAAGSRWGDHHMSVHPNNDLSDRPQMAVLEKYTYANVPPSQPEITSPYEASFNVANTVSYKVTATNNPTSFTVTGLPEGLVFDQDAQLIVGSIEEGSYEIELSATNETGTGGVRTLILRGVHLSVPGVIEVEDFDDGGQGVGYYDTTIGNQNSGISYRHSDVDFRDIFGDGNYQINNIEDGEWLKYTIDVQEESSYLITMRYKTVASPQINITVDGEEFSGDIFLPLSYAWTTMTFEVPVLTQGFHELKFNVISGGFEMDYLSFATNTAPVEAPLGLTAERTNGQTVELGWNTIEGANTYTIKRAVNLAGPYVTIAEGITENKYVDEGLDQFTTYYYTVTASNMQGEGPDSDIVESKGMPLPDEIPDENPDEEREQLEIYPGPSKGSYQLNVFSSHQGEISVMIYNTMGAVVYRSKDIKSGTFEKELDLAGLSTGVYFILAELEGFSESKSFIIR